LTRDPRRVLPCGHEQQTHRPGARLVERRELLDASGIARALRRIASEILERNRGSESLVLVGIRTGGRTWRSACAR